MKKLSFLRISLILSLGLLSACSSTKKDSSIAPKSDDLLELLTGFGESLSKRNYSRAVDFMIPEEKSLMIENGSVPLDKQKMLLALPLQKLIRHPSIRVENGHIAGIYSLLPDLRQPETHESSLSSNELPSEELNNISPDQNLNGSSENLANENAVQLKMAVNKFFTAVNNKNWNAALALMNDDEKKSLLDDRGNLKASAKQRLAQMDQNNPDALLIQDGKLMGVTLLLPSN